MALVTELPETEWLEFLEGIGGFQFFQGPHMLRVLEKARGYRPSIAAIRERGRIRAILASYLVDYRTGGFNLFTTRSVIQGGPVGDVAFYRTLLGAHDEKARGNALVGQIRNLVEPNDRSPMIAAGYSWEDHLDYVLWLTRGEEAVILAMSKSRRKNIAGADEMGLDFVRLAHSDLDGVYELIKSTYHRAKVPLADRSLFDNALADLVPKGYLWVRGARRNGTLCAVRLTLRWQDQLYDWYAGSSELGRRNHADEWLVWQILREGIRENCTCFDFGGAGQPGQEYGPGEFKRRFGGSLTNPGRFERVFHPLALRAAKTGYLAWRKVR